MSIELLNTLLTREIWNALSVGYDFDLYIDPKYNEYKLSFDKVEDPITYLNYPVLNFNLAHKYLIGLDLCLN